MTEPTSLTLAHVARIARVSESTVSRVIRNKLPIAEETRNRVLDAIRQTGYVPNRIAGSLATARSKLIGVILPSLSNIVFPDVLRGIHHALASSGYQPVVGVTDYSEENEEELVRSILSWKPAAMVVTGLEHTDATRQMLVRSGLRIAEIMDIDAAPIDIAVGLSHRKVGLESARYLLSRGYRRFGYVGHDRMRDRRAAARFEGFAQGIRATGLALRGQANWDGPSSAGAGREMLAQLLAQHADLDAVLFSNDDMAIGGVFHCLAGGIDIPGGLAVFGFNALDIGQALPIPLSTVRSYRFEIGEISVKHLFQRRGRTASPTIVDTGFEIVAGATA